MNNIVNFVHKWRSFHEKFIIFYLKMGSVKDQDFQNTFHLKLDISKVSGFVIFKFIREIYIQ